MVGLQGIEYSASGDLGSRGSAGASITETLARCLRGFADGAGAAGGLVIGVKFSSRRHTILTVPQRHLQEEEEERQSVTTDEGKMC